MVVKSLNELIDHMAEPSGEEYQKRTGSNHGEVARLLLGKFMIAVRQDIGIKTGLTPEELGRTETAV